MREAEFLKAQGQKLDAILALQEKGLIVEDPARLDVRGQLTFGRNVRVDINVIFKGTVTLGDNVVIGPGCIIEDAVIGDSVVVKEFSTVSGAHVEAESRVGPYARLRPGSRIGRSCHIGNFVEIKETTMGSGCKINHHSFVGNATLGTDVVIGAGSVTCNHDRKAVTETHIGDRAYVGSGVMLVAPISIGEGAVVAAGSTITRDVPCNTLAICRTRDVVLKPLTERR